MYYDLPREELTYSDREHDQATRLIRLEKEKGKTVPEAMQAVWDWEHEQMMEHKASIMVMLNMYKA